MNENVIPFQRERAKINFFNRPVITFFLTLSLNDFFETKIHAEDFRIFPSFKILRLFAFSVAPLDVISVIISD